MIQPDPWKWSKKQYRIFAAILLACFLVWTTSIVVVTVIKGEFRAQGWVRLTPVPLLLGLLFLSWLAFSEKYGRKKGFVAALLVVFGGGCGWLALRSSTVEERYFYSLVGIVAALLFGKFVLNKSIC